MIFRSEMFHLSMRRLVERLTKEQLAARTGLDSEDSRAL
jgi:hypothetical protein